jgi:hypothetical protein
MDMLESLLKYVGKFTAIGFVVAVVGAVLGLVGKTAADMALGAQMAWIGFQLA